MKHPRWKPLCTALLRGCLFLLLTGSVFSQRTDHSVAIYGGYIDDSQIFLFPQSPDPLLRQQTRSVGGSFGLAAGWRYRLLPTVAIEVRGEYLSHIQEEIDAAGTPVTNGFQAALLQNSALFSLPFSGERFEMYVGGGFGVYSGERIFSVAGVEAEAVSGSPAIGIHVIIGAEYLVLQRLGIRFETVFRDPQIGVENRFPVSSVLSHGVTYPLETEVFRSDLNINGNVYSLGLCWYL